MIELPDGRKVSRSDWKQIMGACSHRYREVELENSVHGSYGICPSCLHMLPWAIAKEVNARAE